MIRTSAALPVTPAMGDYWLWYLTVALAGLAVLLVLASGEPRLWHWYLIPVFLCLMVVGLDTARLACGQASVFSPVGLFGLIGVQFFFGAPLLHVYLDYWMNYTVGPADWRPWLGGMAWLNLAGLIAFRIGRHVGARGFRPPARRDLDPSRFYGLGGALLIVAALAQLWLYQSEGGLAGYIAAYEQAKLSAQTPFPGMGRAMMIAETFPIVAFMMFAVAMRRRGRPLPAVAMLGAFAALLALCVLFGGLRGSRSNTVWVIFWAAMVTHCWLRPLGRRSLVGGMLLLVAFMYGYGLYKGVRGAEGLSDLWQGRVSLSELEERTEKPLSKVLLTDFGRGDIQALILQRIATGAFEPVAGRTYLGALAMLVPRSLWPERPPNKLREGSEMRFGPGAYSARYVSNFVHGLAGEAMINFGPLAVVPAFFLYGCAFARIVGRQRALHPDDPRMLLMPFLVIISIIMLTSDLDNLLWFLIKVAALPAALVLLTTRPSGAPQETAP